MSGEGDYKIYLRDTITGESYVFFEDCVHGDYTEENLLWQWTEGNYGCDCNRFIFLRWETDADSEMDCNLGANRIVIDKIERPDGSIINYPDGYNDEESVLYEGLL